MFNTYFEDSRYEIILTQQQYNDVVYDYCMKHPSIVVEYTSVAEYVLSEFKGEWQAFRRAIVFHDEKYYNWFLLKYANT